ncbi:MAG: biotin/lipoyl-containing protein, partial [Candidatus Sericytochromatia bacterium]|nr:biotin/lipoyl-containing protein [Candidatus Sericytochromatia bacterium]
CLSEAERARIKEAIDPAVAEGPAPAAASRTFSLEVNRQRFEVVVRDPAGAVAVAAAPAQGRAKPAAAPGGRAKAEAAGSANGVKAPMMSRVVKVCVAVGDAVTAGQPLVVVEAMKMESELASPRDGVVQAVGCAAGDTVQQGQVLVSLA